MSQSPPPTYQDAVIQGVLLRSGTTPFPDAPRMGMRSLRTPSVAPPSTPSSSSRSSSSYGKTPLKFPIKPIVEDPISRPSEKPKGSPKSGWQSDTSHSRQKEGILKSYRKKSTHKAPAELSSPSAKAGAQINSLTAYHPHRPLLIMDLSKPLTKIKLGGDMPLPIRDIDLDQLATSTALSTMRIQCDLFSWPINVKASKKTGITHRDVILAVRDALYANISSKEWSSVKDPHREWVKQAFERRCRNSDDLYAVERHRGLRRVDMLTEKTIWKGISSRDGSGAWTLHLSNR